MLISIPIPNLVGGVSQQSMALRMSTTVDALENAWPSIITGLNKRPGTEHIAKITGGFSGTSTGHLIDKEGYQWIITIDKSSLRVFDLGGTEQTVNFPNGKSYLTSATDPTRSFRFVTEGDTTFILNRETTVSTLEWGENGVISFTPDGTVTNSASLPAPGITYLNKVYKASATNTYYKCVFHAGTSAIYGWSAGTQTSTPPPGGSTIVTTLPGATSAGVTVYLQSSYDQVFYNRGGSSTVTYYMYTPYTSVLTQAAGSAFYTWDEVGLSTLVANADSAHLDPSTMATVYITQSISNCFYSIYVNNTLVASFLTQKGVDAATSVEGTNVIARSLYDLLRVAQGGSTSVGTDNGTVNLPARAAFTVTRIGSTISFSGLNPGDTISVTSSAGDKCIKAYRDTIDAYGSLPPSEYPGRIVKVQGDKKNNQDDYYVVFNKGVWVETYGYNQGAGLDPVTMPHVLIRNADGTWTFKPHTWLYRTVGDKNSNMHPSFVGQQLSDMFVYTNRLGFVSDSNLILSEANTFENFYRTTILTLVDSDRIDEALIDAMDDPLHHAVPFNKDLLIFGERGQRRLQYQNYLGPKNISIQYTTSFLCNAHVKPINMGSSVYFIDDVAWHYKYAKVYEYFPRMYVTQDDANQVTDPIPQYIPSGVIWMSGSPQTGAFVCGTENDPTTIYFYKYYWDGERKVQNAWSKWTIPECTKVHWAKFSNNFLYLIVDRSDGTYLEQVRCEEVLFDNTTNQSAVMVDRQITESRLVSRTYNSTTDTTTIVLPYPVTGSIDVVGSYLTTIKQRQVVTKVNSTTFKVPGDKTAWALWVGIPYSFRVRLNKPYLKQPAGQGQSSSLDGRLQLRYLVLEYHQTAYFRIEQSKTGRALFTRLFDIPNAQSGTMRIAMDGSHTDQTIDIINDGPFSSCFGVAEWHCIFSPKTRRM